MSCYYDILPKKTYGIIRNCGKCGRKMTYRSTDKFRVNANGNRLDVWLIYQCEKCKHTYNLPIYERISPNAIDGKRYERFLANDKALAFEMGNDKQLLEANHCVIDAKDIAYELSLNSKESAATMTIRNPYGLKVRIDKILGELLGVTRSRVKKMIEEEEISYRLNENQEYIVEI